MVPDPAVFQPTPLTAAKSFVLFGTFDTGVYAIGPSARNRASQINLADDVSLMHGAHQVKIGADYRAIYLDVRPFDASFTYVVSRLSGFVATGKALLQGESTRPSDFLSRATSLFVQDNWKVTPRLTLTYGLRWELNPAPTPRGSTQLASWLNINNPSQLALAPAGTPLWTLSYTDLAPRLGAAYQLTEKGDLVLRAGWGLFYDLASDAVGNLASFFPNVAISCCALASLPLSSAQPFLPSVSSQPPFSGARGLSPDLSLPRSYQWNVALEKSFGTTQAVSLTYVGQAGRDLLRQESIAKPNANFANNFLLVANNAYSNYDALQIQYRRPLATRLQALMSYSWAHSLDNASSDVSQAISNSVISAARDYASSGFDVRHSFSAAVLWALPGAARNRALGILTRDWSLETQVVARSGFPFNTTVLTANIGGANPRSNLVPGQPVWIPDSTAGGGKRLNPAAFVAPQPGQQGTESRNDIIGFGLTQVDLSLGRKFSITDRINLQFRTDAFNVLNHPNFSNPAAFVGLGSSFLKSTSMLNQGLGGLNPLFQEGGPRSLQLSLKLSF